MLAPSPKPIRRELYQAIDAHIDADDRDEFLDTVVTIAGHHDQHHGKGAGDDYIARVIRSLTGDLDQEQED